MRNQAGRHSVINPDDGHIFPLPALWNCGKKLILPFKMMCWVFVFFLRNFFFVVNMEDW